jgi:hypothetical protein
VQETKNIVIAFCPTFAGHFYRSLTCLIQDFPPFLFELLGTGHYIGNESLAGFRPHPMKFDHMLTHKERTSKGLGHYSPTHLREMISKKLLLLNAVRASSLRFSFLICHRTTSLRSHLSRKKSEH